MTSRRSEPQHVVRRARHRSLGLACRTGAAAAVALSGAALALGAAAPAGASSTARRVGSAPRVVRGAVRLGALPGSTRLTVDVVLRPRSATALAREAAAVSTPGTARYRHYLARGAFAAAFGPTRAAVASVTAWLAARGMSVGSLSADHLTLHVTASALRLERTFAISLDTYRLPGGRVAFANEEAPLVPGALRGVVEGVVGLDDLVAPSPMVVRGPSLAVRAAPAARARHLASASGPQPCATAVSDASSLGAYTANQLASAYNFTSLYAAGDEGAGITIGVLELEPDLSSDLAQYQSCYGTSATISYTQVDGGAGSVISDGESVEDIEDAIGLAPKAHIDVYQAPNTLTGALDDFTAMIDDDTAKVLSTSWGQCERATGSTMLAEENTLFEQAAVQGQSVFAASGDSGSSGCGSSNLDDDDPAAQPYVTGVGGTTLNAVGPPPSEVVWNESDSGAGAGGGGLSAYHEMLAYQSGAAASLHVLSSYSSGARCGAPSGSYCREVPDVAADSDYSTGYLIYYNGRWEADGGTSAAAPLWAALAALIDASSGCGGTAIGFANPVLYDAAATSYASDFHDITSGTNDYTPDGNSSGKYPAATGYDMASGLGTPNGGNLARTLCGSGTVTDEPTRTALSIAKPSISYGAEGDETFTMMVVGKASDGRPLGTVDVYAASTKVCSRTLVTLTNDASAGTCSLRAAQLGGGRHTDVVARFVPAASSSSDAAFAYTASASGPPATMTVTRDATATTVSLSPESVARGDEGDALFEVTVRAHFGERLPDGAHVRVTVSTASCEAVLSGGKGACSISDSALPVGSYRVSARYAGTSSLVSSRGTATKQLKVTK